MESEKIWTIEESDIMTVEEFQGWIDWFNGVKWFTDKYSN